ncbi:MAG TPA: hypothetical protein VM425_00575 [Myxococcota bacterium]|nr:hypothetical protein [Myxococcota bacterium]
MPRITISIPNDLKERITDPRVRKSINLSRVCQAALSREVNRLLDLPASLARMEALLTRLREEKEESVDRWFREGISAGRDWVEHEAPYARLRELGLAGRERRVESLRGAPPDQLAAMLARLRGSTGFRESSLIEGWAHIVRILWEVVEKNL